jgi:DNA-binding NarL/FixJ family response regulator
VLVLVLTTFDLDEYVYAAVGAGASGFLLKDAPREQLVTAVRIVARGEALLAPAITQRLIERFVSRPSPVEAAPAVADLSAREVDVLRLVARGLSNAEIAAELFVGEATVKTHVARILRKLDLRDRVQVVVFAYETGLVEPRGA